MKRQLLSCAMTLPLVALLAAPAAAEVKTREKSQVKIEGIIGRMMNMFGGKAAKEGVVSTAAVKGDRKATMNDSTGQIIDLGEEKVYDLDLKKKTYEVTTFDELRRRMREAREKAEKDAEREQPPSNKPEKTEKPTQPEKEYQVDFDVKETGQKKPLAGYDTREVIMTVTVHEKGKPLDDAGGFVMTATIATIGSAAQTAAAFKLADIEGAGAAVRAMSDLSFSAFGSVGASAAVFLGAASLAAGRSGVLPRWLVVAGAVAAVLEAVTLASVFDLPILGLLAPVLLVLWSLATGVVLTMRGKALFPGTEPVSRLRS